MRNKRLIVLFSILTFVTLIAVLGSVIFSVQKVYASCYNYDDEVMDARVADLDVNGLKRGRSIFMIDENKVIERVENKLPNVRVVNVERKFPNRIYINYAYIFEYVAFETTDNVLYCSNDCKVLSAGEKQEAYADHIKLITNKSSTASVGQALFSTDTTEHKATVAVMDAIERMDLHNVVVEMFELIDLSYSDSLGLTYIKTRTGTVFELQGGTADIQKKLQFAVSVYSGHETKYKFGGTIIVNASGEGANYSKEDRYALRVAQTA